ncbi:serine/threonine-protein kinase [uncultured Amnibacterium sp.]|uniref:serine/threonine-protein kinase n=1 Tax=uncultured Amnibacterium sp. TaxID=1631851 RepID=UPI0035CAEA2F
MSAEQEQRVAAPAQLPDRYRIEHVIGRGGTAVVYSAHDTLLNRPVAIKVFTAPTDSARVLREQQHEAQTLAGLSHHALVTLYDAGVEDSDPDQPHIYLVMERIEGPDLGQRLRSGALTPVQVAYLGLDLCDALLYVHERGWLHRDVKPANVLLADRNSDSRLRGKLSDFGIATVLGTDADDGEFTVGTAAYLSPEQVEGGLLEAASDVYSLGLVLIQAATGRVSYPGAVIESAFARLTRDPEIPDSVPQRLASVLSGMTRRSPRDRIPLAEARAQFERAIADEIARDAPPVPLPLPPRAPEPIADVPPDREFARITGIAARLIRAPSAFVVVGEPGFEASAFVPEAHRAELAQLASRALLVDRAGGWSVDDVHTDPRTAGAVRFAPVRSMAVQPILAEDGRKVGVLAVLDALPRTFGADDAATLVDLAHLVAHEVDLRRAVRRALFSRER